MQRRTGCEVSAQARRARTAQASTPACLAPKRLTVCPARLYPQSGWACSAAVAGLQQCRRCRCWYAHHAHHAREAPPQATSPAQPCRWLSRGSPSKTRSYSCPGTRAGRWLCSSAGASPAPTCAVPTKPQPVVVKASLPPASKQASLANYFFERRIFFRKICFKKLQNCCRLSSFLLPIEAGYCRTKCSRLELCWLR